MARDGELTDDEIDLELNGAPNLNLITPLITPEEQKRKGINNTQLKYKQIIKGVLGLLIQIVALIADLSKLALLGW